MARPKRGNYAYGDAGQARYRKAVQEYNAKMKKLREEKTKIDSTKKNIEKQKTANKKAGTTTKTKTVAKTKSTPTSTAAKGKTLATGKTTSKTKAVETPKTKTATKTRTRTRTQTKSKTTPKTTPKSKTTPATTGKTSKNLKIKGDRYVRKPQYTKENFGKPKQKYVRKPQYTKENYGKTNKSTNTGTKPTKVENFKKAANQTGNFLKDTGKKIVDTGKKQYSKAQTKLAAKDQTPQQAIPEGKSKGAQFAKKVNQKIGNYAKRVYNKAALDTFKFKHVMNDPSKRNINRSGVKRGLGAGGALTIGNALINRLTKPKGMSNKEWSDFKAKKEQEGVEKRRKLIKKGYDFYGKRLKKVSSDLTGKKYDSSTEKNINKQKEANKLRIKGKRTERSSKTNNNVNYNAKTRTRKVVTNDKGKQAMSSFRVDPEKNLQLQKEAKKGNKRTYPTVNASNRKNLTNQHLKKDGSKQVDGSRSAKPGSARAKLRQKNIDRFGEAHVNKLRAKNKDFQAMKKKKLTKKEFIRRYPNSQTAKRARGM